MSDVEAVLNTLRERLIEAERVDAMQGKGGVQQLRSWWPDDPRPGQPEVKDLQQVLREIEAAPVRLLPADITRADEALLWYELVQDDWRRVHLKLCMAALAGKRGAFMTLSRRLGMSKQTLRNRYKATLKEIYINLCNNSVFLLPARKELVCPNRHK